MRWLLALGILTAMPVHAQTYKWVDEKGVTNYSSTPPPGSAANAQVIPERVSVASVDPSLASAVASMRAQSERQAEYAEVEWLQRQRLMATAQMQAQMPAPMPACPYRADCDGYWPAHAVVFVPAVARRGIAPVRPAPLPQRRGHVRTSRAAIR